MENSDPSTSKSDLGLGIIDTACLFCLAGSDWWANYKSLLEDFGLKHEIDETREAERYKFGDGGTLVSSIRVTAPVFVAGKKGRIVFSDLPLLIGRDFLTPARAAVDMGEKTLRIGSGGREAAWLALSGASAGGLCFLFLTWVFPRWCLQALSGAR